MRIVRVAPLFLALVLATAPSAGRTAQFIRLGDLPGGLCRSEARAVSADGRVVVGTSYSAKGAQAFRWTESGGMAVIGATARHAFDVSADGSVVVGCTGFAPGAEAFRWTWERGVVRLGRLAPGETSQADEVSEDGAVVIGVSRDSTGASRAFGWSANTGLVDLSQAAPSLPRPRRDLSRLTGLGSLAGGNAYTKAMAKSNDGAVIVGTSRAETGFRAFIWDRQSGMRKLESLLAEEHGLQSELAGWKLVSAKDVSADGEVIVGRGINPDGDLESWVAVLPRR